MSPYAPLLTIVLVLVSACQSGKSAVAPDARNGRNLAVTWCAECHDIGVESISPVRVPPAPGFADFATDASRDTATLMGFMNQSHLPMPTFRLWPREKKDLVAYIVGLAK